MGWIQMGLRRGGEGFRVKDKLHPPGEGKGLGFRV